MPWLAPLSSVPRRPPAMVATPPRRSAISPGWSSDAAEASKRQLHLRIAVIQVLRWFQVGNAFQCFFLDIVTLLKWNNEDMTGSWISPHHSCIGWGPRYDVIIHLNAKLPYPYQQFGINHCLHFEKGWSSKTNQITTVGWNLFILGENPTGQAKKTCWKRTIWYLTIDLLNTA